MCWNPGVSINTFALGAFAAALALANGVVTPLQAALLLAVAAIQLAEFFLWTHLAEPARNRAWSGAAKGLLLAQAALSVLTLPASAAVRAGALACLGAVFAARKWLPPRMGGFHSDSPSVPTTTVGANGHLRWGWMLPADPVRVAAYVVALLLPMWLWPPPLRPVFWIGLATLAVTLALYGRDGTWGSMWCWSSNAIALWLLWLVFAKAGGVPPKK